MHENSLSAYREEVAKLERRERMIYDHLLTSDLKLTDREIMSDLSFSEPNSVRPRITALIAKGLVREVGTTRCTVTGKRVRAVEAVKPGEVQQLALL